jgi:iron complex outermembrane receptor protein
MKESPGIFRAASCASIVVSICTFLPSAREAAADTPAAGTSGPSQSASTPAPHGILDEVVVTAQKRVENILTVPISITAVSKATLEQQEIKDINDLSRIVPGLSLLPAGQSTSNSAQSTGARTVVIRGIAATAGSATTGIYLDDTPIQGREAGTVYPAVFDLERVEVLRGPQGTLFGAGSEGGTVRFITPTPSLTQTSAYAHSEASFTQGGAPSFEAGVAAGGPIVDDKVGLRASLWTRYDGGYIDRYNFFTNDPTAQNTNSVDSYVGRVSVLVKPTDRLSITPSIYFQRVDKADSDVWWSTKGVYQSYYNIPQPTNEQFYLPSLSIDYQLDSFSMKSITSYYSRRQNGINEFFHSSKQQLFYAAVPNYSLSDKVVRTQDNFTQEFRLTSASDQRLTWVAGVYFADNRESYHELEVEPLANALWLAVTGYNILDFFGVPQINGDISYRDNRVARERELAEFGDATLKITERFKFTAGVRASRTKFSFNETSDGPFGVGGDGLPLTTSGASSEHPVTPKVGASYDLTDGIIYAMASKGYRIGGANQLLPNICQAQLIGLGVHGAAPPYTSDKVMSYEFGFKQRFDDGRLLLAASAFWINWSHIQGVIPLNSCAYSYTGNFGTAVSRGFDLQLLYEPIRGLEFSGAVSMTDAHYTQTVPVPGKETQLLVKNGDPLLFTPKWQGTAGVSYSWPVHDAVNAFVRTDSTYSGSYDRTYSQGVNGYIASIRDGRSVTEVQLRGGLKSTAWDASVFVKNLTDNTTPLAEDVGTVAGSYGAMAIRSTSLQPRTIGVAVSYRY